MEPDQQSGEQELNAMRQNRRQVDFRKRFAEHRNRLIDRRLLLETNQTQPLPAALS